MKKERIAVTNHVRKYYVLMILFSFSFVQGATPAQEAEECTKVKTELTRKNHPPFELWNKLDVPIYYSLQKIDPNTFAMKMLDKDKKIVDYNVDICKQTHLYITIGERPDPNNKKHWGTSVLCFTFNPGKTIYVRIKKEKNVYEFGPQTGPFKGLSPNTESGYSRKNNVKGGIKFEIDGTCRIKNLQCLKGSMNKINSWWSCEGEIKGEVCPLNYQGPADPNLPGPCPSGKK